MPQRRVDPQIRAGGLAASEKKIRYGGLAASDNGTERMKCAAEGPLSDP